MKIGIYGGSFDPVHLGHIGLAKQAKKELQLDKVLFIPAKYQPFKLDRDVTSDEHRVNMLELAVENIEGFEISYSELNREEISYTFNTVTYIKELYNEETELFFLLGTDSFLSIEKWYKAELLLRECHFAVAIRPGDYEKELDDCINRIKAVHNTHVVLLHNEQLDISSTDIRNRIKNYESIEHLVPCNVERYILEHALYR